MKYNKIFILGTTGSGKSTLARKISKITNLTHYGLDWIVYKDHDSWKTKYSKEIRNKKMKELIKKKKWIIEGAYVEEWILPIIKKADLIIILQLSSYVLMKRVLNRYVGNKLNKRGDKFIDMLNLLKFSYLYKKNNFFTHKKMVEKYKKEHIIIKNQKQLNEFLNNLK